MLIEAIIFGGTLYSSFKIAKATGNASTFHKPPTLKHRQQDKVENTQNKLTLQANFSIAALAFATMGLFYAPLGFLSIPFIVGASLDVHQTTYDSLRKRQIGLNGFMSLTIIVTVLFDNFFLASFFVWFINWTTRFSTHILQGFRLDVIDSFAQQFSFVWVFADGVEIKTHFDKLKVGDLIVIREGEIVPVDGYIVKGTATLDQHIMAGNNKSVEKGPGEKVFSASMVTSGKLYVRIDRIGEESSIVAVISNMLNTENNSFVNGMTF